VNTPLEVEAMLPVIGAFERLRIFYYIGGSVASSIHGKPRTTLDADLVAEVFPEHVPRLESLLQDQYYLSTAAILDAIRHRSSFNFIYLPTTFKVDIFLPKDRPFAESECGRVVQGPLNGVDDRTFPVASAEDIVLNKLEWFRAGQGLSDRQWSDLIGVLALQADAIDQAYLDRWAPELGVADLLAKARAEVEELGA